MFKRRHTDRFQSPTCWAAWWTQDVQSEGGICKKNMEWGWKCGFWNLTPRSGNRFITQFYFSKSFPGLQQLYCILKHTDGGDVGALTVVISGFLVLILPNTLPQCSTQLVSDTLVFLLTEAVLSIHFRGPDVGGCVRHRSCWQTGLEWWKKKNFIERMCDDKVSASRGLTDRM